MGPRREIGDILIALKLDIAATVSRADEQTSKRKKLKEALGIPYKMYASPNTKGIPKRFPIKIRFLGANSRVNLLIATNTIDVQSAKNNE